MQTAKLGALVAGCVALGAVALAHPVGAVGGAIYGASQTVCGMITFISAEALIPSKKTDTEMLHSARTTALLASTFFGGWKLAALFGVNMSLKSAATLYVAGLGIGIPICVLACGVFLLGKKLFPPDPQAKLINDLYKAL